MTTEHTLVIFGCYIKSVERTAQMISLTGRDPLSGLNHWKDINAVAGVFRVYFREMSEPLFPMEFNSDYLRCSCECYFFQTYL